MEIADWLKKNNMSLKQLADAAKIPSSTLYAAFSHNRKLSGWISHKISLATMQKVSIREVSDPNRKPFNDTRKQCKNKKHYCKNCGEEVKLSRSYLKSLASQKDTCKE